MENSNKPLHKKMEEDKDNATKSFPNAEKASAAEVNRGNPQAKNYKNGKASAQGPNYNSDSITVDGDTTVNAGTFK